MDERWRVSEVKAASPMLTSEALTFIGVAVSLNASHRAPASPTCAFSLLANLISAGAIGVMRSGGVSGSTTVTFRRHPAANPVIGLPLS